MRTRLFLASVHTRCIGSHPRLQSINVCGFNAQWANQRLQKALGQDVSDVCEYLVNIKVCFV